MSTVSQERVLAYVDGELKGRNLETFLAALKDNPSLREQVDEQRKTHAALVQAYGPGPEREDSDFLLPLLTEKNQIRDSMAEGSHPKSSLSRRFALPQWAAIAASLLMGLGIGSAVHLSQSPGMFREMGGSIIAVGALSDNLENRSVPRPSGNIIAIPVTFHSAKSFCRVFSIKDTIAGLACRNGGQWEVQSVMRFSVGQRQSQYRLASSSLPVSLMVQVDALIKGNPMTETQVQKAQSLGWQNQQP